MLKRKVISYEKNIYKCFPDVCLAGDRIIIVYRESDFHRAADYSHIVVQYSDDNGKTWSDKIYLARSFANKDWKLCLWDSPRVSFIDNKVTVVCDFHPEWYGDGKKYNIDLWKTYVFYSADFGATWSKKVLTNIKGFVPDKIKKIDKSSYIIGTQLYNHQTRKLEQYCYLNNSIAKSKSKSWQGPILIGANKKLSLCEGSIVILNNDKLICYMRENSGKGLPAYKSFSYDGGKSWSGLYKTIMSGCHRPVGDVYNGKYIFITYRYQPNKSWFGPYWAKNTFGYIESIQSGLKKRITNQQGIIFPIDYDNSNHSDSGYTGWVRLINGATFIVNYIIDKYSTGTIVGYTVPDLYELTGLYSETRL